MTPPPLTFLRLLLWQRTQNQLVVATKPLLPIKVQLEVELTTRLKLVQGREERERKLLIQHEVTSNLLQERSEPVVRGLGSKVLSATKKILLPLQELVLVIKMT